MDLYTGWNEIHVQAKINDLKKKRSNHTVEGFLRINRFHHVYLRAQVYLILKINKEDDIGA